jgi:hypothetical protein
LPCRLQQGDPLERNKIMVSTSRLVPGKLFVIILLAACLRLLSIVQDGSLRNPQHDQPTEEVVLARNLADGFGFVSPYRDAGDQGGDPSAHSPPGYPFMLAGVLWATRAFSADSLLPYRIALLLGVVASSVLVGVVAVVGERARGTWGFWCAGLWLAAWPTLLGLCGTLWNTPFSLLALGLGLLWATSSVPARRVGPGLTVGLAAGVFTLFNPLVAPFLAVALLARAVGTTGLSKAFPYLLAAAGAWLLCVSPWLIRNAIIFQRFVPIRANFGLELWMGNQPGADGTTLTANVRHPINDPEEQRLVMELGEAAYMQRKLSLALERIRSEPGEFLGLTLVRMRLYWFGDTSRPTVLFGWELPQLGGVNIPKVLVNGLLIGLGVLGTRVWSSRPGRWLCWFGIAFLPLPYYITHVAPAYRALVDPLVGLLAGIALASILGACFGRTRR